MCGGMHGRGHVWQRGMHGRGACMAGGVRGRRDVLLKRAVCILLECILVKCWNLSVECDPDFALKQCKRSRTYKYFFCVHRVWIVNKCVRFKN